MCSILASLRSSKMNKSNYQRIVTFWEDAQKCEPTFPASRGEWRALIGKFNLDDAAPLSDWAGVIAAVTKLGRASLVKLAQASADQISAGLPDGPTRFLALQLRRAASLVWTDSPSAPHLKIYGETEDAGDFIARLKRASLRRRAVTNAIKMSINKKSPKKDFLKMGPSAKLHTLREDSMPKFKLGRFPEPLLRIRPSSAFGSASQASHPSSDDISAFANFGMPPLSGNGKNHGRSGWHLQPWRHLLQLCGIHPQRLLLPRITTALGHSCCKKRDRTPKAPWSRGISFSELHPNRFRS